MTHKVEGNEAKHPVPDITTGAREGSDSRIRVATTRIGFAQEQGSSTGSNPKDTVQLVWQLPTQELGHWIC